MNMPMLASMICVNRKDLSAYFEDYLQSSFRVWLSDIRFQKAQSMLREETRYSNETVSIECGFSSHAHLYKVFKAKTGMTPIQWRRFMAKKQVKIVSFLRMKHLFDRNETIFLRNETPFLVFNYYICNRK